MLFLLPNWSGVLLTLLSLSLDERLRLNPIHEYLEEEQICYFEACQTLEILYRDAASFILGGVEFEACRESGVACNMGLGGSRSSDSTAA
jgi:hypothetical protein